MANDVNDLTQINWVQQLAKDYLKEKKRNRRHRLLFKTTIFLLILLGFFISKVDSNKRQYQFPHVAVISLEGGIFPKSNGDAEHFIESLSKAFSNKHSKAIFIDINSPGGSPVQADEMYQTLIHLRKKYPTKKVYAVCSDICASAAYYVAAGADMIYANPSSLVGSIGVLFNGFGFVDAMEKIGVTRRLVTAGKLKGFLDPFTAENPQDKQKLQKMLDIVHQRFKASVIQGRGGRLNVTDETFSGLFWTGQQAKSQGLIDGFASIRQLADDKYHGLKRVDYSKGDSFIDRLAKQLGASVSAEILSAIGFNRTPLY